MVRAGAWVAAVVVVGAGCAGAGRVGRGTEGAMVTSFMTGTWAGETGGKYAEEQWGPAHGGRMVGCYRESGADGRTEMFELMEIDGSAAGGARLRIRHFDGAMTPWRSEASPLTLVEAERGARRVVFVPAGASGLASIEYARAGEELRATVRFAPERERGEIVVVMRRVGP